MLLYLEPPLLAIWFDLVSLYTTDVIQYNSRYFLEVETEIRQQAAWLIHQ